MTIHTSGQQGMPSAQAIRRCTQPSCDGVVLRHSLGCAVSVQRCIRCFTRYDSVPSSAALLAHPGSRLGRLAQSFLRWREED